MGEPGKILVDDVPLQGVLTRFSRGCHQGWAEARCVGEGYVFIQRGTVIVLRRLHHLLPSFIIPVIAQAHRVLPICWPGEGASVLY